MTDAKTLATPLREAVNTIMHYQFTHSRDGMRALQVLIDEADNAADLIEQQAAEIDVLRSAAPLCEQHKPNGGKRWHCVICAGMALSSALSKISYLCGEPNEMECGPYDLHCDELAVIEQVRTLRAELAAARQLVQRLSDEEIDELKEAYAPIAIIGQLLDDAMSQAVANGANSISMPDEYVALAAWLAGIPPKPAVLSDAQIDALMPEADFDGLTIDDGIEGQRRMWYEDSLLNFARAIESLVVARMKGTP